MIDSELKISNGRILEMTPRTTTDTIDVAEFTWRCLFVSCHLLNDIDGFEFGSHDDFHNIYPNCTLCSVDIQPVMVASVLNNV